MNYKTIFPVAVLLAVLPVLPGWGRRRLAVEAPEIIDLPLEDVGLDGVARHRALRPYSPSRYDGADTSLTALGSRGAMLRYLNPRSE